MPLCHAADHLAKSSDQLKEEESKLTKDCRFDSNQPWNVNTFTQNRMAILRRKNKNLFRETQDTLCLAQLARKVLRIEVSALKQCCDNCSLLCLVQRTA